MHEDVKKKLGKYKRIMEMIEELNKQARELESRAEAVATKRITDMPRGGTAITTEELIIKKADIEKRRDDFFKRAMVEKRNVQQFIDTVESPRHNRLLCGIYIEGLSVNELADIEGYSARQEWRIYKEAHEMIKNQCQ